MKCIKISLASLLVASLCSPLAFAQDRDSLLKFEYTYASQEGDEHDELSDELAISEGIAGASFAVTENFDLGAAYQLNYWDPDQDSIDSVDLHKILVPMWYDIDIADSWVVTLNATPGVHTDFEYVNEDDFRLQGGGWVTYAVHRDLAVALGVMYSDELGDIQAYPIGGIHWQATDALLVDLIFPNPRITYTTSEWFRVFLFGESSGGEWNVGKSDQQFDIDQQGLRVGGGAEVRVGEKAWFYLAGGGEFNREFQLAADNDGVFDDTVDLDDAGFVRVGLKVAR